MKDMERQMLDLIRLAKLHEYQAGASSIVSKDLDSVASLVESQSALNSPSCDFTPSVEDGKPIHYLGLFVDRECLDRALSNLNRIDGSFDKKPIAAPHVTLAYKPTPEEIPRELFGKPFTLVINGYGYDNENEGVRVSLEAAPTANDEDKRATERLNKVLEDRGVIPHITLSISDDGKAVNTKNLDFRDISPIKIGCVLGGHVKESRSRQNVYSKNIDGPDHPSASSAALNVNPNMEDKAVLERYNNMLKNYSSLENDSSKVQDNGLEL